MEMRPVGILALAGIGLALALLIPPAQRYILFAMAIVPLALLAVGQLILPRSKRSISVWFNPIVIELDNELVVVPDPGMPLGRLSGRDLVYSAFRQWHDFEIVTHRFWLLAAIGLLSLGSIWVSNQNELQFFPGMGFYYFTAFGWTLMVAISKRWLWERRMLRLEGISMAPFSVKATGLYQQIRYHFVDPNNQYRGGWFESMVCSRTDDMTIVFYDTENPDRNFPASGLMFHKLVWKQRPSPVTVSKMPEEI
jgi:hypothetical protein